MPQLALRHRIDLLLPHPTCTSTQAKLQLRTTNRYTLPHGHWCVHHTTRFAMKSSASMTVLGTSRRTYALAIEPSIAFEDLPTAVQLCVKHVCTQRMSRHNCDLYFNHVVNRDALLGIPDTESLRSSFPSPRYFHLYCDIIKRGGVVNDVWLRAIISLPGCPPNSTGCFRCPVFILRSLLTNTTTPTSLIPFTEYTDSNGNRIYSSPWDSRIYESYNASVNHGHVVLMDMYSDGTTMSKSGTQSLTFVRVSLSSLHPHSEQWHTIRIAPTSSSIPTALPLQRRRQLKLQLLHWFMFRIFRTTTLASFSGIIVHCSTFYPRIAMLIADQPEERTLMSLKRRYSDMDCSHCMLRPRIRSYGPLLSYVRQEWSISVASSDGTSSNDAERPRVTRGTSHRNIVGQLCPTRHKERDVITTITHQLNFATHMTRRHLSHVDVSKARLYLVSHSAHDFPSFLSCFAGLDSTPCNLY